MFWEKLCFVEHIYWAIHSPKFISFLDDVKEPTSLKYYKIRIKIKLNIQYKHLKSQVDWFIRGDVFSQNTYLTTNFPDFS